MVEYQILSTEEWRQRIQPLWPWNTDYHWIPLIDNPFGMMQYAGREVFTKVIVFPVMATVDGEPAAYTYVHNISDTHLRTRGVYVEPKFRGKGDLIGPLLDYACFLYPEPWHTVLSYYQTRTSKWAMRKQNFGVTAHQWRKRIVNGKPVDDYEIILLARRFR